MPAPPTDDHTVVPSSLGDDDDELDERYFDEEDDYDVCMQRGSILSRKRANIVC